jgi:hypothetical protein
MFPSFFLSYNTLPVTTYLKIRPTLCRNQETIKIPTPLYIGAISKLNEKRFKSHNKFTDIRIISTVHSRWNFTEATSRKLPETKEQVCIKTKYSQAWRKN